MTDILSKQDALYQDLKTTSDRLKTISGGGAFGLTPDRVKNSAQWKSAKKNFDDAMRAVQQFNTRHAKEIRDARRVRNPHRRGPNPRGKVPPHLRRYLFKKGHR